jgi:hypothetical protein
VKIDSRFSGLNGNCQPEPARLAGFGTVNA